MRDLLSSYERDRCLKFITSAPRRAVAERLQEKLRPEEAPPDLVGGRQADGMSLVQCRGAAGEPFAKINGGSLGFFILP
jgi:hypothetical protein